MVDEGMRHELRRDAELLRSTNRSGEKSADRVEAFERLFKHLPDLVDALEQAEAERDDLRARLTGVAIHAGRLSSRYDDPHGTTEMGQMLSDLLAAVGAKNMTEAAAVEAERDALKAAVHQVFDCWADPFGNWTAEQATAARAQKSQMLQRLLAALDTPSTEGAVEDGPEVLRLAAGAEADLADEFKAGLDAYKASDARVRALCEQAIQSAARSVGAMSVSAMSGEPVQATVRVVDVLAALDTPSTLESPEKPRHIGDKANAEDCPACRLDEARGGRVTDQDRTPADDEIRSYLDRNPSALRHFLDRDMRARPKWWRAYFNREARIAGAANIDAVLRGRA